MSLSQLLDFECHSKKIKMMTLHGHSMWPYLKPNDILLWQKTESLELGDIAVLKTPTLDNYIVHRLIKGNNTKGDCEKWIDQKVHDEVLVLGKAYSRLIPNRKKQNYRIVPLQEGKGLSSIQTVLNTYNCYDYWAIHRFASVLLKAVNYFVRGKEIFFSSSVLGIKESKSE